MIPVRGVLQTINIQVVTLAANEKAIMSTEDHNMILMRGKLLRPHGLMNTIVARLYLLLVLLAPWS